MEKNKNKTIILLVSTMVLVILGIAFLSSISGQTLLNTQKTSATDESHSLNSCYTALGQVNISDADCNVTLTYAPTGWEQSDSDCYLSSVSITNATGTALTLNTDYKLFSSTGVIQFLNTTKTASPNNITLTDYAYCGEGYMADSWARSVLNTNTGLYALAILLAVIAIVYLLFGKNNDDD